ncbi:2-hydroxyacyl-CoA dehydratase [Pseudonocardia sp. DLS-67]
MTNATPAEREVPANLDEAYRDREAAARRWHAGGGTVVGYFADDVPVPLIEAAGHFPFRISSDPGGDHPATMARGPRDVRADRFEMVNSWVHLFATGHYDFVDRVVVSNSRKYVLQVHERLSALPAPPRLTVFDRALGDTDRARGFNRRQVYRLADRVGGTAARDRLREAIDDADRRAALVRRLAGLREAGRPRVSGAEALRALGAARFLPARRYNPLLERFLDAAVDRPPLTGPRLFVIGSPLDRDDRYELIEREGAVIVGEHHGWGGHLLERAIGRGDPPLDALAEHVHSGPDLVFPLAAHVAGIRERVARARADAVLFHVYEHDDATLWEVPSVRRALTVPSVYLAEQPFRRADPAGTTAAVRQLVGELV